MSHTVVLNFFILLVVAGLGVLTNNPLVILGLFFLQDLPVHVVTNEQQLRASAIKELQDGDDDDDDMDDGESAIGFTAPIK